MLDLIDSFKHIGKLPTPKYGIIKSEADFSNFSFPAFLKANLSEHKLELGAVKRCNNLPDAQERLREMRKKFPTTSLILQEAVQGEELVLGIKQDPAFGKLLMLGFGGSNIELIKDITFLTAPSNETDIRKAIENLKLYPSLVSRKKLAIRKFTSLAERVSKLDFKEADFNPVILNETECLIVDARISL